jgi:hypothetical protein
MEEPQSLYMQGWKTEDILRMRKEYAKWAYENGINNEYAKEYSKGTYTRKQQGGLHKAQAGVNQNSVNNQDESDIPYLKPISSKEAWAKSEPEIRKAWGLESPKLEVSEPDPYAVKYKNKDMYNVDFERLVNQFNTGANMALNWFGQRGDREREQQMFDNLTADNLYTSTNDYNRGTYDPNSGLFRQDLGFKGVIQKGGSTYKEGGETYMSAKQIAEFIANGGEIEFI